MEERAELILQSAVLTNCHSEPGAGKRTTLPAGATK